MSNQKPYITIVVVSRNDNYGGNLLYRMQLFLNNQFSLWERYGLNVELLLVEWNPPADQPRLCDALRWPVSLVSGSIKIIEVPPEIHKKIASENRGPLLEYEGKNVGIRRARGEYILITNIDLLYSEELIEFFASKKLRADALYRVDRYDLSDYTVPTDMSMTEQLAFCASRVALINNRYGASFLRNEKKLGFRNIRRLLTHWKNSLLHFPYSVPYTNAAGDFILIHRQSWHTLRGFSITKNEALIDGVLYAAMSMGLKQVILESPMRIYHINHEHVGRDQVWSDAAKYKKEYIKMLRSRKPWVLNNENWGLADETLPEYELLPKKS